MQEGVVQEDRAESVYYLQLQEFLPIMVVVVVYKRLAEQAGVGTVIIREENGSWPELQAQAGAERLVEVMVKATPESAEMADQVL
jgi:hypothetical protein